MGDTSAAPVAASRPLRILIVEDSYLTANLVAGMIRTAGHSVLGPVPSVKAAMDLLDKDPCDAAVLDINLGSETSESIAWRLDRKGVPFFFISGYAEPKTMLTNTNFRARRLVPKPVDIAELRRGIEEEFQK